MRPSITTRTKESTTKPIAMFECEFQRGMKFNSMNPAVINTNILIKTLNFDWKNDQTYLMAKILKLFLNWCTTKLQTQRTRRKCMELEANVPRASQLGVGSRRYRSAIYVVRDWPAATRPPTAQMCETTCTTYIRDVSISILIQTSTVNQWNKHLFHLSMMVWYICFIKLFRDISRKICIEIGRNYHFKGLSSI